MAKDPKRPKKAADAEPASAGAAVESAPAESVVDAGYQVLARRYRSKDFGEVVGQEAIARTLQNAIRTGRTAHAYLFTGTRGVGKTSMARIFARALNAVDGLVEQDAVASAIMRGQDIDVIEIDAASNRGIDNARDLIAGAGLMPARGRYKIYIIDEVHMLTTPAFNALLKTMEEPPAHVKFILCTTEPQSVPATIQSRCQRFDFKNIATPKIAEHLRAVLAREKAEAEDRVVLQVARLANGSMRDALSLIERLLAAAVPDGGGRAALTWQLLEDIFGLPDETLLERLVEAIGRGASAEALAAGGELLERGLSVERALDLLAERFRWLMLAAVCGSDSPLLEVASETRTALARIGEHYAAAGAAGLVHLIALCDSVASKARDSSSPRALYDAALVRMALAEQFAGAAAVLAGAGRGGGPSPGPAKKAVERIAELPPRSVMSSPAGSPPGSPAVAPARAVAAPPPAAVVESKPVPDAGFWNEIVRLAAASPRDAALVASLEFRSLEGRTVTVTVRDGEAGAGYLTNNSSLVKATLDRLAGRPLEVRVEVAASTAQRPAPLQRGAIPNEVREHPVVKLAADLFDAAIVDVQPLRRGERSEEASPFVGEGAGEGAGQGSGQRGSREGEDDHDV